MYQANTDAYELPAGKCTDINLFLHGYRYRERCHFLEPKIKKNKRKKTASVLQSFTPQVQSFGIKGSYIILPFPHVC